MGPYMCLPSQSRVRFVSVLFLKSSQHFIVRLREASVGGNVDHDADVACQYAQYSKF